MEPVDPIDYQREAALSLSVHYLQGRAGFSATDALEIADLFLKYLKGAN